MVGVPRSQGCRNCRRKKKGCDLQKPVCGQCVRLKLCCIWDDKRWTFVTQDPATMPESSKQLVHRRSEPGIRDSSSATLHIESHKHSLARTAFEVGSIGEFWDLFVPKDSSHGVGGVSAGFWIKTVQDLATFDQSANLALRACSLTALGSGNLDPALLQNGTRLYAKALRETNNALQDLIRAQSDAVLASCKLLSMYENFRIDISGGVSTQGQDWHKHIEGICRIIELRGPAKHVSQHGHALFEEARMSAVIAGITLRKPNFLSGRAWYTIPWQTSPRNLRDELCDIMVAFPDAFCKQDAIFQKLKCVATYSDLFSVLTEGQDHINHCIHIATLLKEWEQRVLAMCSDHPPPRTPDIAGPLTLLEICKDYGYGFFHVVMQYWAACIILFSSTWIAHRTITTAGKKQQAHLPALMKLPDIPDWMNPQPAALNITRCASHYFSTEQAGLWGPISSTFPIGAALHYFAAVGRQDSEELYLLRGLFERSKSGHLAGQFLRSMANTGNSVKGDPADVQQHTLMARSWYGTDLSFERGKPANNASSGESTA